MQLFGFFLLLTILMIGMIGLFFQKDTISSLKNQSSSNDYKDWCIKKFMNSEFHSEFINKDDFVKHVIGIISGDDFKLMYIMQTGDDIKINNLDEIGQDIAEILIEKKNIKILKNTLS